MDNPQQNSSFVSNLLKFFQALGLSVVTLFGMGGLFYLLDKWEIVKEKDLGLAGIFAAFTILIGIGLVNTSVNFYILKSEVSQDRRYAKLLFVFILSAFWFLGMYQF